MINEGQEKAGIFLENCSEEKQLEMLMRAGADYVYWNAPETMSSLVWVLEKGVEKEFNMNTPLPNGENLIHHLFCFSENKKATQNTLEVLKKFGADIECKMSEPVLPNHSLVQNELGYTPFLMCAKFGNLLGATVLFEEGADVKARGNNGFGFLDIYRSNMKNSHQDDTDGRLLKWFIETEEGEKQMHQQMDNPKFRSEFMEDQLSVTQKWLAHHEKKSLGKELPNSDNAKSGVRL